MPVREAMTKDQGSLLIQLHDRVSPLTDKYNKRSRLEERITRDLHLLAYDLNECKNSEERRKLKRREASLKRRLDSVSQARVNAAKAAAEDVRNFRASLELNHGISRDATLGAIRVERNLPPEIRRILTR